MPGARFARGTRRGRPALVVWTEAAWSVVAAGWEAAAAPPAAAAGWAAGGRGWPGPGGEAGANGLAPPGGGPDAPGVLVGSGPVRAWGAAPASAASARGVRGRSITGPPS